MRYDRVRKNQKKIFNHMNKEGFINIVPIVLVIVLAGATGYFFLTKKSAAPTERVQPTNTQSTSSPTPPAAVSSSSNTLGWKTYKNEKYGIEFEYPMELSESVDTNEFNAKYYDATQIYIFDSGDELYNMKHGLAVSIIGRALAYNGTGLPWWSGGVSVTAMNVGNHVWYLHPIQDEVCGGTNAMTAFESRTVRAYFTNACDDNDHVVEINQRLISQVLSAFKFVN